LAAPPAALRPSGVRLPGDPLFFSFPVGLALPRGDLIQCAALRLHPDVRIAGQHRPRDVARDPHDHFLARAGFREFRDERVPVVVPPTAHLGIGANLGPGGPKRGHREKFYPVRRGDTEHRTFAIQPNLAGGHPVIEGTGIRVSVIVGRFSGGETVEELAEDYGIESSVVKSHRIRNRCVKPSTRSTSTRTWVARS
jgi:uncharacterized protein (DUF433 family)